MPAAHRLLDPDVIARLRGLELRARGVVAGSISGMHRSAYHGYSVEFAEHRQYVPGDDLRHIDWRLFGRQDRFYIKEYEEETNLRCNILLDASRSMAYAGAGISKFEYARRLAAVLAFVLIQQQDAAGLLVFDERLRTHLPAHTGNVQLANLTRLLEQTECGGRTDVKVLFHRLAEELRKRSMVLLISDLLAPSEDVLGGLEHICHNGHELIVLHVLDDDEWNLPFVENVRFEGLEDATGLLVDPQGLRPSYLAAVEQFCTRVKAVCLKHRGDYLAVNTRDPLVAVLSGYLARRSGRLGAARRS